jgi:DNA-directed RNA polymerase subunit N (RpoN/RPB10)
MYLPIVCASCGYYLGARALLFKEIMNKRMLKLKVYKCDVIREKKETLHDVFEALHIEKLCCRSSIFTIIEIDGFI